MKGAKNVEVSDTTMLPWKALAGTKKNNME
jgi:hypothetical protein